MNINETSPHGRIERYRNIPLVGGGNLKLEVNAYSGESIHYTVYNNLGLLIADGNIYSFDLYEIANIYMEIITDIEISDNIKENTPYDSPGYKLPTTVEITGFADILDVIGTLKVCEDYSVVIYFYDTEAFIPLSAEIAEIFFNDIDMYMQGYETCLFTDIR